MKAKFLFTCLLCFIPVLAFADNFNPGETVPLAASTASSSVSWAVSQAGLYPYDYPDVMISNAGVSTAFVGCGTAGITANVPAPGTVNATPIMPGETMVLHKGDGITTCAAITATGTTTLYFTAGQGN